MAELERALGALWRDPGIISDFHALCGFGGRLAGTESEQRARAFVAERMSRMGGQFREHSFEFTGNVPVAAHLRVAADGAALDCTCLPGSASVEELHAPVVDVGLGTEEDFRAAAGSLAGAVALVRHEYPFSSAHFHRRRKYLLAVEAGCSAFIIANNIPGIGPVAGGCGTRGEIPAVGVSHEAGLALARAARGRNPKVVLTAVSEETTWRTANLILDIPGATGKSVLIGAHLDGHVLAQSAMDNATGVVASMAIAEGFSRHVEKTGHGLRLAIFNVEEWGLEGSRHYLESLGEGRESVPILAVILDSITGFPRLSALTAGNAAVESLCVRCEEETRVGIDIVRPLTRNSDHYNFQSRGIPALRLIAGYGEHSSLTRYLLTPADTEEIVVPAELKSATLTAANLTYTACAHWG